MVYNTPTPTSVHTLKGIAREIPDLVMVFFCTLLGELQAESDVYTVRNVVEIKATASDVVFNCIILLGNFHYELAILELSDSGIAYMLTEAGVLAEGLVAGFMKGKYYNRSTRIHQILVAVMEKALVSKYTEALPDAISICARMMSRSTFTDENYTVDISIPPLTL